MARARLCKYFVCNIVLVVTLLYCHDINAITFQNLLVVLLTCHWYFISPSLYFDNSFLKLLPNKAKLPIKPIHGCDLPHWNKTASVMFPHGATSYDRNKMVLSFPMVRPNFFINTFAWYFLFSDINWILNFASASEIQSSVIILRNAYFSLLFQRNVATFKWSFLHATRYEPVDEISWCDHTSEAFTAVLNISCSLK